VLGRAEDAASFAAKAEAIRAIYNRELFKPDTPELYGSGSQTSLALPLALGLAEPSARAPVLAALLRDIETRGHSSAGAIGTRYLFRALTDAGHSDLIYRLITDPEKPGYAHQLKQGATALAESWTAWTGASQNHFFLGPVTEWFYHDLAGIAPDETAPGFKHIVIRPHPVPGLEWVEASHQTPHGRVAVRWEQNDGKLILKVSIPSNTTGTVYLPAGEGAEVRIENSRGATARGREGDRAVYGIASGTYQFEVGP
jgi:alpha-L-rhamnosidase